MEKTIVTKQWRAHIIDENDRSFSTAAGSSAKGHVNATNKLLPKDKIAVSSESFHCNPDESTLTWSWDSTTSALGIIKKVTFGHTMATASLESQAADEGSSKYYFIMKKSPSNKTDSQ